MDSLDRKMYSTTSLGINYQGAKGPYLQFLLEKAQSFLIAYLRIREHWHRGSSRRPWACLLNKCVQHILPMTVP